jgi:hypothetical protein
MKLVAKNAFALAGLSLFVSSALVVSGCTDSNSPSLPSAQHVSVNQNALDNAHHVWDDQPSHIRAAIAVQDRHTSDLLDIDGVIGTGVGEDDAHANTAVILVFTSDDNVHGVPASIEGVKTKIEHVGTIHADPFGRPGSGGSGGTTTYNTKAYTRPLVAGTSTINTTEGCAAGTIGCFVTIPGDTNLYMLSNNHVFANENNGSVGNPIIQPGAYDQSCNTTGRCGSLAAFKMIASAGNDIDAAIARVDDSLKSSVTGATIAGWKPASSYTAPTVGMAVTKVGRTSGVTTGTISAVNVTISVQYDLGVAQFTNQIYVKGQFIKAGDSGSLMVTNNSAHTPVGLCFAGSSSASFANPIGPVLGYFGATVWHN